jgi:flagellar FlgN protein
VTVAARGRETAGAARPRAGSPVPGLGPAVIDHMTAQIASARRLLDLTVRQSAAIRARNVDTVVRRLSDTRVEMGHRERLELERSALLERAGSALGVPAEQVRLEDIATLLPRREADQALSLSAELRGLLAEVQRETQQNRALMRQELSFLDHLLKLAGHHTEPGYRPTGKQPLAPPPARRSPTGRRMLDLEA